MSAWPMRGQGTGKVISGPMIGPRKKRMERGQTYVHADYLTKVCENNYVCSSILKLFFSMTKWTSQ